jgi:hypothetical protein
MGSKQMLDLKSTSYNGASAQKMQAKHKNHCVFKLTLISTFTIQFLMSECLYAITMPLNSTR